MFFCMIGKNIAFIFALIDDDKFGTEERHDCCRNCDDIAIYTCVWTAVAFCVLTLLFYYNIIINTNVSIIRICVRIVAFAIDGKIIRRQL